MTDAVTPALRAALEGLAATDVLLVATDFDGTMAPIVVNSWEAAAPAATLDALAALGALPRTHTAVLTGRSLAQLAGLGPLPPSVVRIGSHGAEWGDRLLAPLTAAQSATLTEGRARVVALLHGLVGAVLEDKPAGFAVHVRAMPDRDRAERVPAEVATILAGLPDMTLMQGKQVIEATVAHASKGIALGMLREALGATAVVYAGDDVTDETVFEVLGPKDVGIKVGDGPTVAAYRVADPAAITEVFAELAAARAATTAAG